MKYIKAIYVLLFGNKNYGRDSGKVLIFIDTAFAFGRTVRTCLDCGKLIGGGVTRCNKCANT